METILVPDELWEMVEPLLPKHKPSPTGGKPRVDDRVSLTGILFVLKTGIPWEDFPQEMGCCGITLWNRLAEWNKDGVWDQLHRLLLGKLRDAEALDFNRVVVDSSSVRAMYGKDLILRVGLAVEPEVASLRWAHLSRTRLQSLTKDWPAQVAKWDLMVIENG